MYFQKVSGFFVIIFLWLGTAKSQAQFPSADISNGLIGIRVYLPDRDSGYYRSTRFDWAGVMPVIEYKGHTYSGQWFNGYNPKKNDAVMGPVDSFSPLGYEDTSSRSFVQIGVGVLAKRGDNSLYSPFMYYDIIDHGKWSVSQGDNDIRLTQQIQTSGYSYQYKKEITLPLGASDLELAHSLLNTGNKIIEVDVFNHNFFVIDNQPTGPDFSVNFPFKLAESTNDTTRTDNKLVQLSNGQISFTRMFEKRENAYLVLTGYGETAKDYFFNIKNHKTGAAVEVKGDAPLSKLIFWASSTTLCPEPYIHIKINPGEEYHWKMIYHFYVSNSSGNK